MNDGVPHPGRGHRRRNRFVGTFVFRHLSLWDPLVEKLSKRCAYLGHLGERPAVEVHGLNLLPNSRGLPLVLFTCLSKEGPGFISNSVSPKGDLAFASINCLVNCILISSLQLATLYQVEFLAIHPGYSCICNILCYILTFSKNVKWKKTWKTSLIPLSYLTDLCMGMGMGQKLGRDCLKGEMPFGKEAQDGFNSFSN